MTSGQTLKFKPWLEDQQKPLWSVLEQWTTPAVLNGSLWASCSVVGQMEMSVSFGCDRSVRVQTHQSIVDGFLTTRESLRVPVSGLTVISQFLKRLNTSECGLLVFTSSGSTTPAAQAAYRRKSNGGPKKDSLSLYYCLGLQQRIAKIDY